MCPESCERASKTANLRPSPSTTAATERTGSSMGAAVLKQQVVFEELGVRRKGAVAALARRAPTELLVEPSPATVPREPPKPCAAEPTAAHDVEHEVVRPLGD